VHRGLGTILLVFTFARLASGRDNAMKRFFAHLIAAIVVTFGTASLAPAEILIGMPGPLTGGWPGSASRCKKASA
jgi:hypothetical protein